MHPGVTDDGERAGHGSAQIAVALFVYPQKLTSSGCCRTAKTGRSGHSLDRFGWFWFIATVSYFR
jgi:hypothetical protein